MIFINISLVLHSIEDKGIGLGGDMTIVKNKLDGKDMEYTTRTLKYALSTPANTGHGICKYIICHF